MILGNATQQEAKSRKANIETSMLENYLHRMYTRNFFKY
jgi:hypothetical protein